MDKGPSSRLSNPLLKALIILAILLVAGLARFRAVALLPIDFDEDDYLRAAQLYAAIIKTGSWQDLPTVEFNREHPSLGKLLYGVALAGLPPASLIPERKLTEPAAESLPQPQLNVARAIAAVLGALQVLLLACLDPLAGLFLALHTFTIKYTSLAILEALPALTSAIAIMSYDRSRVYAARGWNGWLALSAIAMGLTAASKYAYCVAGFAILAHWGYSLFSRSLREKRIQWWVFAQIALWCALVVVVFIASDPYLWPAPIERLLASVVYHVEFAQGPLVRYMNLPVYMPLRWLFIWVPWHPDLFPIGPDPLIATLAILGFARLWKGNTLYAIWLATALAFLFIWPTKWPQYILILTFPWSLAAAQGFRGLLDLPFRRRRPRYGPLSFGGITARKSSANRRL
jgi:hypothetical protein